MAAPPPALPDELFEEILLRLPPSDPACILRASLVCKSWGSAVSNPGFRRRLQELHRVPPVLGFLHSWKEHTPHFIPTTASAFSLAAPDCRSWRALDSRHGRALFLSEDQPQGAQVLLVWEPITGDQQRVPVPAVLQTYLSAGAVVCAADGCDHSDCHGGPFRVVVVFADPVIFNVIPDEENMAMWACMYSSETGTWGEPTSVHTTLVHFNHCSSVVVGKSLLYFLSNEYMILEYDLDGCGLALVHPPNFPSAYDTIRSIRLILSEEGELGVAEVLKSRLYLWSRSREAIDGREALWVQSRGIHLNKLLPIGALATANENDPDLLDYAEAANAIFVGTINGLFTIELQSKRATKVYKDGNFYPLISVVSFYTPKPRGEHQDPLKLNRSEEACGEEGAEEDEKTVDQAQQLFDKGSNAIKERDFVNASECIGHYPEIRFPCYGEVAPKCASTVYKHGCASGCSLEDVAPPSEEGDSAEGRGMKHGNVSVALLS
uniref:Uncharacterized protein n=1 Tax=Avena sativa TaxID=4498 RepID=A0ACD6A791_AVESA